MSKYTPKAKVSKLKVERDGNKFKASWTVPSAATKNDADNRFTDLDIKWRLYKTGTDVVDTDKRGNERATSDSQESQSHNTWA